MPGQFNGKTTPCQGVVAGSIPVPGSIYRKIKIMRKRCKKMKYPIEKYNIVVHQHKDYGTTEIIAFSTYAGKVVKGNAICHINDTYDEEKGKKLAIARCAEKIARKRKARATRLLKKAQTQMTMAQKYVDDMTSYYNDACVEVNETKADLDKIYAEM